MKRKLPSTSHAANDAMTKDIKEAHYSRILTALRKLRSANYEAIAQQARMDRHAVGRRLIELLREGKVWKPGGMSKTSTGRNAFTYQCIEDKVVIPAPVEKSVKGKSISQFSKRIQQISQQSLF
jgi:predicted ArsR family transcriptional regulator